MILKPLDKATRADLEALVANGVAESRSLDYKQALPGSGDSDRKEFLADVCAFANSGGGDLVYGVVEDRDDDGKPTGVPRALQGLTGIENLDPILLQLEQSVRAGIEPRVSFNLKPILEFDSGPVLILRVHPSWAGPHMVSFKGSSRFFARGGAGKYQMDIHQIREAFQLSSRLEEGIRGFRDQRLSLIKRGEAPAKFPPGPKVVLHSVPFQSMAPGGREPLIDLSLLEEASGHITRVLRGTSDPGPNLDGWRISFVGYDVVVQMFRNGALEFVDGGSGQLRDNKRQLHAAYLGRDLVRYAGAFLKTHASLDLAAPSVLLVSLLDVRDCFLVDEEQGLRSRLSEGRFDREVGSLPDVLVEDFGADVKSLLRPILDIISQAAGYDGSPLYDLDGG